jgi:6,7-dimethyl-8-ribityllumazine synthase
MARPPRILIVTSRYYAHIAAELEAGVIDAFKSAGAEWDIIEVPGAFEIPAAIAMSTAEEEYDGYVALGCVIRGETGHYDLICNEVARALMDLSLAGMAIGFGVLTVENEAQAVGGHVTAHAITEATMSQNARQPIQNHSPAGSYFSGGGAVTATTLSGIRR